jgi:mono/diheme cytochrome c family protein
MSIKLFGDLKIPARNCFFLLFLIVLIVPGCKPKNEGPHPIEKVISSMSDTLPVLTIPEDEDPESENWKGVDLDPKSPVKPLYPDEEATHFLLPPGYKIEPVLTEPQIEQPGAISFDGNGRMYVLELRTYMLTADSDGTLEPVSRISRWEDKNNDGIYESGTTFVDKLIFPRFVLPYGKDAVLTMNSDEDNVYKYTDTDGDGMADKKEFFTNKFGRSGNVEHQQAFMYWGMDNWLYSTVNAFRVKETSKGVIREKTGYNRAQWGITHDNDGKLWFQGGWSGVPSYFQFPIHYGNFEVEDEFEEGFEIPWGAPVKIADMQGGMDEVRQPDGSLKRVTGAAGNDIYRGDRLPKELIGQYFYGEPVARIVRQINPVVTEGLTKLHNVYQDEKSEFLRSTDPLFRPVDMATAPDGTMYIVDMYHGIIQEGQWAQKGTYLRTKIEQYQLDKVVGLGRIWRISYEGNSRDKTKPRMFEESPAQLAKYLEHPNGWWRDKAQQILVMAQDGSVVPTLKTIVQKSENLLGRFHALWTLEGLNALDPELLMVLLKDPNPRMRIQALRASESLSTSGKKELGKNYIELLSDTNTDVAIQAMLTSKYTQIPSIEEHISSVLGKNQAKGVQLVGKQILNPKETRDFGSRSGQQLTDVQQQRIERGGEIFNELCAQCHGPDGKGTQLGNGIIMAPSLASSSHVQAHPEYVIKTLLHGLEGPIDGEIYPGGIMVGMGDQSDEWIASVSSYIRLYLDNGATLVNPEEVAKVRSESENHKGSYQYNELLSSVPQTLIPAKDWKVTASHSAPIRIGGTASPLGAFNFEGWTAGEKQKKGMWYQIEFPDVTTITEIHFNSPPKRRGDYRDRIPPIQSYPRSYELQVSSDGVNWNTIDAGKCDSADAILFFEPNKTKFLRIILTDNLEEEGEIPWSMRQMKIFGLL